MRPTTLTAPTDFERIKTFIDRLARQRSRNAPWLAEFQEALLTDPDLNQAIYDESEQLAKSALESIVYRLFRQDGQGVPDSIGFVMVQLGVVLRT